MVAILVADGIHRHMHGVAPFLGLLGAPCYPPYACARDSVEGLPLWSVLVGVHVVWIWPTFTATHTIQAVVVGRAESHGRV